MLLNAGITKLQANGWSVIKKSDWWYLATKADKVIDIAVTHSPTDGWSLGNMSVYSNSLDRTKVYNLTNAMKTLSDMPHTPRGATTPSSNAYVGMSKTAIMREYVNFEYDTGKNVLDFPANKINFLDIHCQNDIDEICKVAFAHELAPRKKSSSKNYDARSRIDRMKKKLWQFTIDTFQKDHPDIPPLRKVEVTTSVPGYDEFINSWYHVKNLITTSTAVFAFTADEASNYVNAVTGGFANVKDLGVFAIGDKAKALQCYQDSSPVRAQVQELKNMTMANSNLAAEQKTLASATREHELCEKKVEFATFLDNLAAMAVEGSSSDDVESVEPDEQV